VPAAIVESTPAQYLQHEVSTIAQALSSPPRGELRSGEAWAGIPASNRSRSYMATNFEWRRPPQSPPLTRRGHHNCPSPRRRGPHPHGGLHARSAGSSARSPPRTWRTQHWCPHSQMRRASSRGQYEEHRDAQSVRDIASAGRSGR